MFTDRGEDSGYIVNFVNVIPEKNSIEVYRIIGKTNLGLLTKAINKYDQDLVASFLPFNYNELKSGAYVSSISSTSESITLSEIKTRIAGAIERFLSDSVSRGLPRIENLNIENVSIENLNIPAQSYVVANLLNNLLDKRIPTFLRCPKRPDEKLTICLDFNTLEKEFWQQNIADVDERFSQFCTRFPKLCKNDDGCSKFFRVVKCITMRFQHIMFEPEREELYLVLHHYYRRLSNLNLKHILNYISEMNLNPNILIGVRVNYRMSSEETKLCEIAFIENSKLELKCEEEKFPINIDRLEQDTITINPTYKHSRNFIEKYLCRDFDRHRDLNKLYPKNYFSNFENEIKIVGEIIKRCINKFCIGGALFSIYSKPLIVW